MTVRRGRPPELGVPRTRTVIIKMHESEVEMLSHLAAHKECSSAEVVRDLVRRAYDKAQKAGNVPRLEVPYPEERER